MARLDVRDQLVAAAERLFAERGSEAVSLREITAAAGATNASAIQYHFGDRGGLMKAVLEKHRPAVEARRHALLDHYDAEGGDLRTLAAALVRPWAAELSNDDGGPGYLQLFADLFNRPQPVIDPQVIEDPTDSLHRWREAVFPHLDHDAVLAHRRFIAMRFAITELARQVRARPGEDAPGAVAQIIDLVAGLLATPVSEETRRARVPRVGVERSATA